MKTYPKRLVLFLGAIILAHSAQAQSSKWVDEYDRLLSKYATPRGLHYAQWNGDAADLQALRGVVDGIAQENLAGKSRDEQLAFHLNAYNAWILHEALQKYPTKSVKDPLFTFFTSKRIKVAGQQMSFSSLEKEIIIPKYKEPRIHMALNCASRSCPPLLGEAFRAARLEAQLERLSRDFVNSERGVKIARDNRVVALSSIFDWYKEDFGGENGVIAFINKRRVKPLPPNAKITYQKYDWSLNETK